jgi:hypothetical protein
MKGNHHLNTSTALLLVLLHLYLRAEPLPLKMRRAHELKESTLHIPEERLRVAYVRMTAPAEAIMELIRLIAQSHGMNIVESNPSAAPLTSLSLRPKAPFM